MVQRLVRPELLRHFAGAQSARARDRPAQSLAGRLVAPSRKDFAMFGAVEYSPEISVRGLRVPRRKKWVIV
jgi:hypothetical protein